MINFKISVLSESSIGYYPMITITDNQGYVDTVWVHDGGFSTYEGAYSFGFRTLANGLWKALNGYDR